MAKTERKTLRKQYTASLDLRGIKISDCQVLGFSLPDAEKVHIFHYKLMNEGAKFYIFDGVENKASVVIPKGKVNEGKIQAIALLCGGSEYTPNID